MSVYAFDDSGAPSSTSIYTTLVILHGCAFHKATFQKLLPLADKYNLRVVLVNRRGYPGSKPLSEADLRQYDGPDERDHERFFGARAQELADFLLGFAVQQHLPKAGNHSAGGIAVMGWSAGNAYSLSLLSHADGITTSTRTQLEDFVHTIVIFDAPAYLQGRPLVRAGKSILLDESYPEQERFSMFGDFAGAYFQHSSVTSHNIDDLLLKPHPSSASRFTADELKLLVTPHAAMSTDIPAMVYPSKEFALWTKRALFDDELSRKFWPGVKVAVIWCEHSMAMCVEAGWGYEELKKESNDAGIRGRPLQITMMPGANHFPHWDRPEQAMAFFAMSVGAKSSQA